MYETDIGVDVHETKRGKRYTSLIDSLAHSSCARLQGCLSNLPTYALLITLSRALAWTIFTVQLIGGVHRINYQRIFPRWT